MHYITYYVLYNTCSRMEDIHVYYSYKQVNCQKCIQSSNLYMIMRDENGRKEEASKVTQTTM